MSAGCAASCVAIRHQRARISTRVSYRIGYFWRCTACSGRPRAADLPPPDILTRCHPVVLLV
eukprot:2840212-Pleurochrysis_carterae.AAC.1